MTHFKGEDNQEIHKLAWYTFLACTRKAKGLNLYGAGQEAIQMSQFLRRLGEFEPARLGPEAMEYTTLPDVLKSLEPRFKKSKK